METKQDSPKTRTWLNIIIGLAVLVFFIYSYQSIMRTEPTNLTQRKVHLVRVLTMLSQPNLSDNETNQAVAMKMLETIQIAFLATLISAVIASILTFIIARSSSSWGRVLNFIWQPILAAIRSVHPIISILFVIVLTGIGAKSGVLALTSFSTAVLTEKYSEFAQENKSIRWPLLFKCYFPSLTLKYFRSNMLIASILGFMGGGGIGFFLQQSIMTLDYRNASTGILACIIVIGGIDFIGQVNWRRIQKLRLAQVVEQAYR